MAKKRILVAPLNWGLGHATRCIPIIRALEDDNFTAIIASDGAALELLKKEFPHLEFYQLPSYNIRYSRFPFLLKFKLLLKIPHILKTISEERKFTEDLVQRKNISGIISDNRWGVRSKMVPSVFITHQVHVLSGLFTFISSKIQQNYIQKFTECWIPDVSGRNNLSGTMSLPHKLQLPVKYLGILSRFKKEDLPGNYEILALVSGPEPQRGILENILLGQLKNIKAEICLVRGIVEEKKSEVKTGNLTVFNYLNSQELEHLINSSKFIVCRPGYTSVMDLVKLGKSAYFIPTPGQPEQQYLARRLEKLKLAPYCQQGDFEVKKLKEITQYEGLGFFPDISTTSREDSLNSAFTLFKSKRKFASYSKNTFYVDLLIMGFNNVFNNRKT